MDALNHDSAAASRLREGPPWSLARLGELGPAVLELEGSVDPADPGEPRRPYPAGPARYFTTYSTSSSSAQTPTTSSPTTASALNRAGKVTDPR